MPTYAGKFSCVKWNSDDHRGGQSTNPQDSGGATDESEETATTTAVIPSLGKEILSMMQGAEPTPEGPVEETPPAETTEKTATEETETETEPAAAEAEATDEETETEPPKGDVWPESAKKRVAEETAKRKKWQAAADKMSTQAIEWREKAQELAQRLQQASGPRPNAKDPLADVYDAQSLARATEQYTNLLDAATSALDENPTETEIEISIGKNEKGEEQTKTFTRKQLSEMKRTAELALTRDIPKREKYIVERAKMDALAAKVYPQFVENEGSNEWFQTAQQILAAVPELERIPDCWIWIGHALLGRQMVLEKIKNNGDVKKPEKSSNPLVEKIRSAPKVKVSPPIATRRVPSQSTVTVGADVEAARKRMRETGTDESMEDFVGAVLAKGASRGYERVK